MKPIFDINTRSTLWNKFHGKCGYCGIDMDRSSDPLERNIQFCIDHIIPVSRGGVDLMENLMPACRRCNSSKRDRQIEEYRYFAAWMDLAGFVFSKEQIRFLDKTKIILPTPEKDWVFYFENHG
ncbi:hypothetical protein LCGC14_1189640 [marine sediment metagenome]|uniref:HNH nuclease domain-containing protein n=1 Tax=marine sediment metagenome TaxID=412755 RepID=A0A0F9LPP3_9ZZZZ